MKSGNEKVILFESESDCCGCAACAAVCPSGAITMQSDFAGFLYPHIDHEKCVRCRKCLTVCAFKPES